MSTSIDSNTSSVVPETGRRGLHLAALGLLALVTAGAAALRVWQINESLWVDELHTAWTASGSLAEVAPRAQDGNQSPLYFYLIWLLVQLLGMSETAVRLPSLAAGVVLVPAAYFVVWRWTASRAAALLTALLTAVDPHCLLYSLEGRPYALVQLGALLHIFVFSRLLLAEPPHAGQSAGKQSRSLWPLRLAFVLGAILLFHLHYTAALLLPGELLAYLLVWVWRRRRLAVVGTLVPTPSEKRGPAGAKAPTTRLAYRLTQLAIDLAVVAIAWSPAAWHLAEVAARRANWQAFITQGPIWNSPFWFPVPYAVIWPAITLATAALVRWLFAKRPLVAPILLPLALLAICWEVVPAAIAWTTTQLDVARLFHPRYLNVSAPAAAAIAGLLCGWTAGRFARLLQLLLIGAAAIYASNTLPSYLNHGRFIVHNQEDWRGAVDYVNQRNHGKQPVLVVSGLIESHGLNKGDERLRRYCLLPVTGIYRLQVGEQRLIAMPDAGPLWIAAKAAAEAKSSGGLWLVVRAPRSQAHFALDRSAAAIAQAGVAREQIRVERRGFGDVTVFLLSWPRHEN